ncbi:MAG: hypothetical protein E4H14_10330 [Candidatus Thorarchaeota archaeon]|nr:MAG: hypothetical protein E4H14_10330 [Candidatus Thorarchaeota archaeon]
MNDVQKDRREHLTRVVVNQILQSLDDSMELATGIIGVLLLGFQILIPELITIANLFNLFVVGLIWVSYKIAKIRHAIDLRLLIIAFSYQLFGIWIVGIFFTLIFASFFAVILMAFGLVIDMNIVFIFVLAMIFLITAGSRKAAKTFARGRCLELVTDNYRPLSITQRYTDTALATVERSLPHPFVAFTLFFLIFWAGQPAIWISMQLEPLLGFLLVYTLYKLALYSYIQEKENSNW